MFRFVDKVAIGDELLAQGYDNLTPAKVVNVSTFKLQGDYLSDYKHVFKNIMGNINLIYIILFKVPTLL